MRKPGLESKSLVSDAPKLILFDDKISVPTLIPSLRSCLPSQQYQLKRVSSISCSKHVVNKGDADGQEEATKKEGRLRMRCPLGLRRKRGTKARTELPFLSLMLKPRPQDLAEEEDKTSRYSLLFLLFV